MNDTRSKILRLSGESRSAEPEHLSKVVEKELPWTWMCLGEDRRGKEMKEVEVLHHCMFMCKEGSGTTGGDGEMGRGLGGR